MQWFSREAWSELAAGERAMLRAAGCESPSIVLPGAFNPLHEGHVQMAAHAARLQDATVWYELSIKNVDKPRLQYDEVARRLTHFNDERVVLTSAATFAEKSALFPGATFLVGVDTLVRIGDPAYYDGSIEAMVAACHTIQENGCRFLVYGRVIDGEFETLDDARLPIELVALSASVDEADFRRDVSSTHLRTGR